MTTIHVDEAERNERQVPGYLTPGEAATREKMIRRALILIRELREIEVYLDAELKVIEHGKLPERKRRDLKQERKDFYAGYLAKKGY